MLCQNCQNLNADTSYFCTQCGEPLREQIPEKTSKKGMNLFLAGALLFVFILGYFSHNMFLRFKGEESQVQTEQAAALERTNDADCKRADLKEKEDKRAKALTTDGGENPEAIRLALGEVVVENPWGKIIARIPSSLLAGSWLALPSRGHLGGDKLTLRLGNQEEVRLEKGIWRYGDPVSLWFIEGVRDIGGPELYPWKEGVPVRWVSILTEEPPRSVNIVPLGELGRFVQCAMPPGVKEPGVFIQENHIVGWSFGEWQKTGFLWAGPKGEDLEFQITIENTYLITFADGREEQFSKALAMGADLPALDRLEAFAEGFRLSPKLTWQETPSYLRAEQVLKHMRSLALQLLKEGLTSEVTGILDDKVLLETADPQLLSKAMVATLQTYGIERAVELAEGVGDYIRRTQENKVPEVDRLHAQLYAKWLREILDRENAGNGWAVHKRAKAYFPDNPEIHLLGVELSLAEGNWQEARRLLEMIAYPESLVDRARILNTRINAYREEENKIMVRFSPGSRQIPLKTILNGSLDQAFVLDTGSSMVTIPYATAEALGIEIGPENPERMIVTAGGTKSAKGVRLSSIELGDWIVYDVAALVLDIPEKPGLGLLGLNYLNRFWVEINQEKGVLSLKPR